MSGDEWPEWLTPEYGAIHDTLTNCVVSALDHCYASADGAGMDWTTEGWISVSVSNIIGTMRRLGCTPPTIDGPVKRRSIGDVHREWQPEYSCETCFDHGEVEAPLLPCPDCSDAVPA